MLLRILFVITAMVLVPSFYIARYEVGRRGQWGGRFAAFMAPHILLWLYAMAVILLFPLNADNSSLVADTLMWVYAVGLAETAFMIPSLPARISRRKTIRRYGNAAGLCFAAFALWTLGYGYTVGAEKLHTVDFEMATERVPIGFDNYKIVQLTDLHLGTYKGCPDMVRRMVDSVNAQKPNLIVVTGDMVNFSSKEVEPYLSILKSLKATDGIVAVTGNHDYGDYDRTMTASARRVDAIRLRKLLQQLGWRWLMNEHFVLSRHSDSIIIAGTENYTEKQPFADVQKTLKGTAPHLFTLLLTHTPELWEKQIAHKENVDLTLVGHVHGYQYSLFGLTPSSVFGMPHAGHYTAEKGGTLYVSRGVGMSAIFPVRYEAYPEINVITLKHRQ